MPLATKGPRQRQTVLRSLRSALNTAAALGVVPYSLRGQAVVFGAWQLPFSIVCAFISPFLGCYALIYPNPKLTRSPFSMFVFLMQYVANSLSIIIFLLWNIAHRSDLERVAVHLLKVERMLVVLNVGSAISYNRIQGILLPIFFLSCSAGHILIDKTSDIPTIAMILTIQYGNFFFMNTSILILFLVDSIHHYLDSLVGRVSSWDVLLVRLCDVHDRLAIVTASIQKIYGLQVLCIALCIFTFVNCNLFFGVKFINKPVAVVFVGWILITTSMIFQIFLSCDRMREKAEEFHTALYRIMKKDKTYKLLNNDVLRAHSMMRKSFGINATGFADVDLKFFAGMISATVTYTVILLQMGKDF